MKNLETMKYEGIIYKFEKESFLEKDESGCEFEVNYGIDESGNKYRIRWFNVDWNYDVLFQDWDVYDIKLIQLRSSDKI
jgi:hypothetical protein